MTNDLTTTTTTDIVRQAAWEGLERLRSEDFAAQGYAGDDYDIVVAMAENLSWDAFWVYLTQGQIHLDFAALYGLTFDQLIYVARSAPGERLRENARLLLSYQDDALQFTCSLYPVQMDLVKIWWGRGYAEESPVWQAAMERTAKRIPWKIHTKAEHQALIARARHRGVSVASVKRTEIASAIMLAMGALNEKRLMRFGANWVRTMGPGGMPGPRVAVEPGDLRWEFQWKWLCAEVPRLARASLLDLPASPNVQEAEHMLSTKERRNRDLYMQLESVGEAELAASGEMSDPLHILSAREGYADLLIKIERAPVRERELANHLISGATIDEIAAAMHIDRKTAEEYQRRLRIRLSIRRGEK